jgi:hypothetical protein
MKVCVLDGRMPSSLSSLIFFFFFFFDDDAVAIGFDVRTWHLQDRHSIT